MQLIFGQECSEIQWYASSDRLDDKFSAIVHSRSQFNQAILNDEKTGRDITWLEDDCTLL